nr:MDR family oxidoreductase [uncultured Tolumonas sp.]
MYKAIVVNKDPAGYHCELEIVEEETLPQGDVTIQVHYSSLNYKDGLAISGKGPIIRQFPMVPGIDLTGTVLSSESSAFSIGDSVILTGWGVGEKHPGGLAQKARVNSQWLIKKPDTITMQQAMAVGTAGFTAMLCVNALEKQGVTPKKGSVLVTGANGGVGAFAVSFLSRLGYQVVASTGRPEESDFLIHDLGASEVINRAELAQPGKPLQKEQWAAVIDTVGSHTLANACASVIYGSVVAACGMAQGMDLPASVAPFILRGVTLVGVDSVMYPQAERQAVWERIASLVDENLLNKICTTVSLGQVKEMAAKLLDGKVRGRVVVDCQA